MSSENQSTYQPTIPLSVIEELDKANPYKDDSSITFDSDAGKALENKRIGYWQAVSKLRELLQSQPK